MSGGAGCHFNQDRAGGVGERGAADGAVIDTGKRYRSCTVVPDGGFS